MVEVTNAWYAVGVGGQHGFVSLSSSPIIINSNHTWSNTNHLLSVHVTVKAGATLTISGIVYCTPTAKIIVQPGGRLIVDGGTLTSACDGALWQGIEVQGNIKNIQSPAYQGVVELKNNARIENAICGIRVVNLSIPPIPPHLLIYRQGGGIVQANDAFFVNNTQAVYFAPYTLPPFGFLILSNNVSYFKGCHFTVDKFFYKAQVELHGVRSVLFENCNFACNQTSGGGGPFPFIFPPDAIYANNSNIRMGSLSGNGCTFSGFNRAIYLRGSNTSQSYIYSSSFSGNFTGIVAEGSRNVRIENNQFNLSAPNGNFIWQNYTTGIYLKNSSLYNVENNNFQGQGLFINGYGGTGIVAENTGTGTHFVKNNTFKNLCTACLAIGINGNGITNLVMGNLFAKLSQGLVYQCNRFENNGSDISVAENSTIRFVQSGQKTTSSSGNTFLQSNRNISYNESRYYLNYQYRLPIGSNQYPYSVYNPFGKVRLSGKSSDDCLFHGYVGNVYHKNMSWIWWDWDIVRLDMQYKELELAYNTKLTLGGDVPFSTRTINWEDTTVQRIVDGLEREDSTTGKSRITINGDEPTTDLEEQTVLFYELTELKQEMDAICYAALDILASNEEGLDIEQYRKWVRRFNTVESEYLLADSYLESQEFEQANGILNAMPDKFSELDREAHQHYREYVAVVQEYAALGEDDEMPPHLINELARLSSYNDFVAIKAYSLGEMVVVGWTELYPRDFEMHPACACSSEDGSGGIGDDQYQKSADNKKSLTEKTDSGIKIYPNPTTGQLIIDNGQLTISTIEMYNIVGQKVNYKLSTVNYPLTIDISHLSAGLYFLKIDGKMFKVVKE